MNSSKARQYSSSTYGPWVFALAVAIVGGLSACSDAPTALNHTDTVDGDVVVMAAQVTAEIRHFEVAPI